MYPHLLETPWIVLRSESMAILVGTLAGLWLVYRVAAPKGRAYQNMLLDLAFWLILVGIAGARLWEILFTWTRYADRPWERLAFWQGGMSIQGSILGGLAAALVFAWRHRLRVWELLDVLTPGVLLGQAIGRIGCLLSGDAFGRPVSEVSWWPQWLSVTYSMETPAYWTLGPKPLIPAEGLEGLLDLGILALLLIYRPARAVPGRTVLLYAVLYSEVRFGLEFLRADSLEWGGLKVAQLLSVIVMALGTGLLVYRSHSSHRATAAG